MKKEELMIGDWVDIRLPDDEPGEHMYLQVEQLRECEIDADFETSYDNVYPIPLTPEILEKNGFVYFENRESWELIPNNGFGICKDEDDNCFYFSVGIFDAYNRHCDITYHYITKVKYVHELQHAFKFCGIEKEIVL